MGVIPLVANAHAKAVGFEKIRGMGTGLPIAAKLQILEETARDMTTADSRAKRANGTLITAAASRIRGGARRLISAEWEFIGCP